MYATGTLWPTTDEEEPEGNGGASGVRQPRPAASCDDAPSSGDEAGASSSGASEDEAGSAGAENGGVVTPPPQLPRCHPFLRARPLPHPAESIELARLVRGSEGPRPAPRAARSARRLPPAHFFARPVFERRTFFKHVVSHMAAVAAWTGLWDVLDQSLLPFVSHSCVLTRGILAESPCVLIKLGFIALGALGLHVTGTLYYGFTEEERREPRGAGRHHATRGLGAAPRDNGRTRRPGAGGAAGVGAWVARVRRKRAAAPAAKVFTAFAARRAVPYDSMC